MDRILIVQCFRRRPRESPNPRFDPTLGILASALGAQGWDPSLMPLDRLDKETFLDRVRALSPDVVFVSIDGMAVDLARRALGFLRDHCPVRTWVGGAFARIMPAAALSMPNVHGVVVGEPEEVFPRILRDPTHSAPGVYRREEASPTNGSVSAFHPVPLIADLDALPFANRAIFAYPADWSCFDVQVVRGCPYRCAYCTNDTIRESQDEEGAFVRRRSPDHVCDEIDQICMAFPETSRLRFPDHAFALDCAWLKSFVSTYEDRCGLPFTCHARANAMDEGTADLLQRAGCDEVEIELISGSNFIRNEILDMDTDARQIERAIRALRDRGIRIRSVNLVGVPYSSELTETDTIRLNQYLRPDTFEARIYYPFPGTRAAELTHEMAWLSNRGEQSYSDGRSVLDMPRFPASAIEVIAKSMPHEVMSARSSFLWRMLTRVPLSRRRTLADWVAGFFHAKGKSSVNGVSHGVRAKPLS